MKTGFKCLAVLIELRGSPGLDKFCPACLPVLLKSKGLARQWCSGAEGMLCAFSRELNQSR